MILDFSQPLTSRTQRVVNAAKLHRAAARRKQRLFLVEGPNAVEAAVATGSATDVFVTEKAAQRFEETLTAAGYLEVFVHPIDDSAAASLAETVTTAGIFAVCRPVLWRMHDALGRSPRLVTVPVETSDPGNAGTLIRVSDALGADAVLFAGDCCDPQSNKVARSSAGSLFHVPVARNRDLHAVIDALKTRGLAILAADAEGETELDEASDALARPTAWLFGNEAHGLPDELLRAADHRVRVPIRGRAESLNLATAAAICLHESAKAQREER